MPHFDALNAAKDQATSLPPIQTGESPFKTTVTSTQPLAEQEALLQLAAEILQDPLAMQYLCDRVYTLMQQDLQRQRERSRGYGRQY